MKTTAVEQATTWHGRFKRRDTKCSMLAKEFLIQRLLFVCAVFLLPLSVFAEIRLPALFSNRMVLQRGQELPVWGWAEAGSQVEVQFGGKTVKTQSPASGKWMLRLPAQSASAEGRKLTIKVND